MKVCVRACSILINLTKYTYTRKYVVKVDLEKDNLYLLFDIISNII